MTMLYPANKSIKL